MNHSKQTSAHAPFLLFQHLPILFCWMGIIHILLTLTLDRVATSHFLTQMHNGSGVWYFAPDSMLYLSQLTQLETILSEKGWIGWLGYPAGLHVRLFSFAFHHLGNSIYSLFVVTTTFYLLTLYLVYQIATTVFDRGIGIFAASMTALWPSYLIHSTQILKDTISIPFQLSFIFGLMILIRTGNRQTSLWRSLAWIGFGYAGLWQIKQYLVVYYLALWTFTLILMLSIRHPHPGSLWKHRLTHGLFLCLFWVWGRNSASSLLPRSLPAISTQKELVNYSKGRPVAEAIRNPDYPGQAYFRQQVAARSSTQGGIHDVKTTLERLKNFMNTQFMSIAVFRDGFRMSYRRSSSNIDINVAFTSPADIIAYMPRALMIGLLAPFPNMWFDTGKQTGRIGRLLSGAEMSGVYVLLVLAGMSLFTYKSDAAVLLLGFIILSGTTLYALIIPNVGCLYRMRYAFLFLIFILAMQAARRFWRQCHPSDGKQGDIGVA